MTTTSKIIVVLAVSLLVALGYIAYLEIAIHGSISQPEHDAAMKTLTEAGSQRLADLDATHKAELAARVAELTANVSSVTAQRDALQAKLDSERTVKVAVIKSSPKALQKALAEEADVHDYEVHVDADTLFMPRRAGENILAKELKLKTDLAMCEANCTIRLEKLRLDIEPPLIAARQAADRRALSFQNDLAIAMAEKTYAERQLRAAKADTLKWALISAAIAIPLSAGATVGGLAWSGHLRR